MFGIYYRDTRLEVADTVDEASSMIAYWSMMLGDEIQLRREI